MHVLGTQKGRLTYEQRLGRCISKSFLPFSIYVGFFNNSMLILYEGQGYPDRVNGVLARISDFTLRLVSGRPSLLYQVQASCVNQKYDSSCPASKRDGMMQCAGHTSVALCPDFPTDHVVLRDSTLMVVIISQKLKFSKTTPRVTSACFVTPQPRFFAYGVVHYHLGIISYRKVYVCMSRIAHNHIVQAHVMIVGCLQKRTH